MVCKKLGAPALASVFVLALLAQSVFAETSATPPKPAAATEAAADSSAEAKDLMKFSKAGHQAIDEIETARLAIFDGNPKLAMDLIAQAKVSVSKAEQEAPSFTVKTTELVGGKAVGTDSETDKVKMVPVDGQIKLADDFVATPDKKSHIDKANEHFKNGRKKEALEELRLGDIDVQYKRYWMPIASTYKHIDQATNLMGDQKYYEANLALKAIDDSLRVDTVDIIDLPKKNSK